MNRTLCSSVFLVAVRLSSAADPWTDLTIKPEDVVGSLSCASASCHGSQQPRLTSGTVTQQEFVHWLGSSPRFLDGRRHYDPRAHLAEPNGDPHALAAWRMTQPRFHEVLRRASAMADGSVDARMAVRCARCHDPLGMKTAGKKKDSKEHQVLRAPYSVLSTHEHGIGCESCHGGARRWLSLHYEDGISREQRIELGMIDTKNLLVRARVCAACHVGSSENDMNHDMIAAGHPPLRFELASYEALLKPKHWNDLPQRLATSDYELQLWAAGRLAAADAALELLASRAAGESTNSVQRPWPELSEVNCFACHQALQPRGARVGDELATDQSPAALGWQAWNIALLDALLPNGKVIEQTRSIQQVFERSLVPDANQVSRFALAAQVALRQDIHGSPDGVSLSVQDQPVSVATICRSIPGSRQAETWDEMCQQLAAMAAVRRTLMDRQAATPLDLDRRLQQVAEALRLSPSLGYFEPDAAAQLALRRKLNHVAEALSQADSARERSTPPPEAPR